MKKQILFNLLSGLAATGIALTGLQSCSSDRAVPVDSFSSLSKDFNNPPMDYRTAPFSVWNGEVTDAEIDRTLNELKEAGSGGAFIHPRPGLITEYLGNEWFSLFGHALQTGKRLGLNIWIYDENSYPSGFAGGHVPAQMPESYDQGQGLALTKVQMLGEETDACFICLKKDGERFVDITANMAEHKGLAGEYYLYNKIGMGRSDWYGGYSYVDLLQPGVTEKFIEVTMEGYEKNFKDEFGTGIKGVFTDEPNIATPGGLRWTPDLFDVFKQKWGYDLKPLLPLLEEEVGDWKRVRHNYMETLLQLFIDRWSKPYHQYCEENNLIWTGHYWEHGWPRMNDGPDNMAMYAWHQMPGIDMLFNQFNEESPVAQFGNVRAVKELRSVANQMGNIRTLSETYGGGGWDETFKDFKRLGDWEYVLGVNFMNQHLSHMTLTGARKYDYPPVFTYHSPWWEDYKPLNDYFARLSLVMSKGIQQNDILVIEPNSTLWSYYSHTKETPKLMEIGQTFQSFVTELEKSQIEYDLGSENIIKDHGRVDRDRFVVGKAGYTTVVLPPMMETLNKPTFDLLKEFVKQGGCVVAFAEPNLVDGSEEPELKNLLDYTSVIRLKDLKEEKACNLFGPKNCDFSFQGGDLYHHRRQFKDGQLLFLVNSSMDEATKGTITLSGKSVVQMDAEDGRIYHYPSEVKEGKLSLPFRLEPAASLLLFITDSKQKGYPEKPVQVNMASVKAIGGLQISRIRDNALNIDFCDLTINGRTTKDVYFANAADMVYREFGFINGNPWNSSVQYKRNILDRDTFSCGGFTVAYHFKVNDNFDYSCMKLVTERPELFSVKVNGKQVKQVPGEWWLDRSFGVYKMGELVKQGMNTIELSVAPMSIYAEIEPVYIIGDFSVVPESKGWSIDAPIKNLELGSWKEQKHPFYSWGVSYAKNYNIKSPEGTYAVRLNDWEGTVAEVYVNGLKAGIIYSDPYCLDVTPYMKQGNNSVEVHVIGSHKNLLGPHYRNPGSGIASPWHWKGIEKPMPGNEYQMLDYGLMTDFDLLH